MNALPPPSRGLTAFPPYACSHPLRERDELVEGFAPTLLEAHLRVLFSTVFVGMDRDRCVFCAGAVRLEQDHRGKKKRAVRIFRPIGGLARAITLLERAGPNELFVLDHFEIAALIRELLSLRRAHHEPEDAAGAQVDLSINPLPWSRRAPVCHVVC